MKATRGSARCHRRCCLFPALIFILVAPLFIPPPSFAVLRALHRWLRPLPSSDREINERLKRAVPLEKVPCITINESYEALKDCRERLAAIDEGAYTQSIAGVWDVKVVEAARSPSHGGPVQILIHRQARVSPETGAGLPLLVWIHGGAFTLSSAADGVGAPLMRDLAGHNGASTDFVWASIQYRLAPEATFRDAVDDCVFAMRWLLDLAQQSRFGYHVRRLSFAGVSAGANLASTALLRMPDLQLNSSVLLHPFLDPGTRSRSYTHWGHLGTSPAGFFRWSWNACGQPAPSMANPALSREWEKVSALKVLVCTSSADPMQDEGVDMVRRLRRAGVNTKHVRSRGSHAVALSLDRWARGAILEWWHASLA